MMTSQRKQLILALSGILSLTVILILLSVHHAIGPRLAAPLEPVFIKIVLIGLMSIGATILTVIQLTRRAPQPLNGVSAVVSAVTQGDLDARCLVTGTNEAAFLATAINDMLDTIVTSQKALQRDSEELRTRMEERDALQAQLVQAQKMEAIGRVAGGVAHDFNNLLTVIIGNCQLAMADLDPAHPSYSDIAQVLKAGERAAELTSQLLVFSRKQSLKLTVMQLNDAVESMKSMLKRILGEKVAFDTTLSEDLYTVRADPGQIEQVLMNLVVNACDAMDNAGTLTIETGNVSVSSAADAHLYGAPVGEYAALSVIDTGCGMDAETQASIFEPFFTTKDKERGTGLGLSTAYGILQRMDASLSVESAPGEGSIFRMLFKRATRETEGATALENRNVAFQGNETVLVVDDEDFIVEILAKALVDHGYKTINAGSAEEALNLASQNHNRIDFVIADIVLPGMDGPELCEILQHRIPGIKALYVTGYDNDPDKKECYRELYASALRKPFSIDQLLMRVRETLDDSCILPKTP